MGRFVDYVGVVFMMLVVVAVKFQAYLMRP